MTIKDFHLQIWILIINIIKIIQLKAHCQYINNKFTKKVNVIIRVKYILKKTIIASIILLPNINILNNKNY